jgi:hypothetical protein
LDYGSLVAVHTVDLRGAIVADLPRGRIEARDRRRLVALPAGWLDLLVAHAPQDALEDLGRALGDELEPDARAVLDESDEPSADDVAYAVTVALATRGLGVAYFERWGDALSLVWRDAPGRGEAWSELAAAAAAALLGRLTGLDVAGAPVAVDETEVRVLLASRAVCDDARRLAHAGHPMSQIVARLARAPEGA